MLRHALLFALSFAVCAPAAAQTTCRTNALGSVSCSRTPAPRWTPFTEGNGLEGVQRRPEPDSPILVPRSRTDAFGNTRLAPDEAPRVGERCRRNALGHLSCG